MTVTVREALFIHPFPVGNVRKVSAQGGSAVFFHVRSGYGFSPVSSTFPRPVFRPDALACAAGKSVRCPTSLFPGITAGINS